jgi:hypothetical protein
LRCAIAVIAAGLAASSCLCADGQGTRLVPLVSWGKHDHQIRVDGRVCGRLEGAGHVGPTGKPVPLQTYAAPGPHWYEARCKETGCWRYMLIMVSPTTNRGHQCVDLWPELAKWKLTLAGSLVVLVALAGLTFGDAICQGRALVLAAAHGFLVVITAGFYWPVYMVAVQKESRV